MHVLLGISGPQLGSSNNCDRTLRLSFFAVVQQCVWVVCVCLCVCNLCIVFTFIDHNAKHDANQSLVRPLGGSTTSCKHNTEVTFDIVTVLAHSCLLTVHMQKTQSNISADSRSDMWAIYQIQILDSFTFCCCGVIHQLLRWMSGSFTAKFSTRWFLTSWCCACDELD